MKTGQAGQSLHGNSELCCTINDFLDELINLLHEDGLTHQNVFLKGWRHYILCSE